MKNFTAGIHILIKKGDEYLLLKRGDDEHHFPECWDMPGGGIEWGEQPWEAAIREAQEEASLEIKVGKIIDIRAVQYKDKWSMEFIAEAEYIGGEVKLNEEHSDFKWLPMTELLQMEPKGEHLQVLAEISQ